MPFFEPAKYFEKLDCVSLQVHKSKKYKINIYKSRKRVCLFAFRGSITVEASMIVTIFMMAILFVESFMMTINTEMNIQMSINNIVKAASKNKFYLELADEITDYNSDISSLKEKMEEWLGQLQTNEEVRANFTKTINISYLMAELVKNKNKGEFADFNIYGGTAGINISKSRIENGFIDMVLNYKIKVPFINKYFPITQRALVKDWTGSDITKKQEIVYVTKTGTVYHKTKECKYLNLDIIKTTYGAVKALRNNSGAKYKNCEYCGKQKLYTGNFVYITDDGNRYHIKLDCQSLTREVMAIDISKIQNKKPCSSCGQGE